jgi:diguanylate cyclase (GGDEF)-like protein
LYIDLDGFKAINDRCGHAEGDAVLKYVAETLSRILRQTDIIARLGGDEIAVILPDTDLQGAVEASERICTSIGEARSYGYVVSASIGAVAHTPEIRRAEELMAAADEQLYRAKDQGGNKVCRP